MSSVPQPLARFLWGRTPVGISLGFSEFSGWVRFSCLLENGVMSYVCSGSGGRGLGGSGEVDSRYLLLRVRRGVGEGV